MEEKIFIINEFSEKLAGLKTIPSESKEKYPTIILVHGFGVTKEEKGMFNELSSVLSSEGYLVFRFDFSGRGESQGDYRDTSLTKLNSDLEKILDYVKEQDCVDTKNIGIVAQSFGTSVTVSLKPDLKAIVLTGSISNPKKHFTNSFKKKGSYDPSGISTRPKSDGTVISIGAQFWEEFDKFNLLKDISQISCPILFIHGEKDPAVSIEQMEDYYKNANEPKEKYILRDANHDLKPNREEAFKVIVNWFNKSLNS
jgi:uncharacterized protein